MPGTNKIEELLPGNMYHIYKRGNNKENLFIEEKNYFYFLNLWRKHISPLADTFAYCLLKNHFHFLIRIKPEELLLNFKALPKTVQLKKLFLSQEETIRKILSQQFSNFFNAYAKSINSVYERTGSLFQERFRRKSIDSDNYFTEIIFYIHANAQKHGLVNDFRGYPHSSYLSLLSDHATLLMRKEVIDGFGGREAFIKYHERYRISLINEKNFLEHLNDD
ncbi:MAG: hypothetical protein M3352_06045 [Bacteroidota bacterium]|nr:hypothetical protein [Bacteroidota bacterium]